MTLRQAKSIVHFLLDQQLIDAYSDKLNSYFDLGQKRIAATTDFIERKYQIIVQSPQEFDLEKMDAQFYKLRKVEGDGNWRKLDHTHIFLEPGSYQIFYNVYPQTITNHTPETYEFEISEFGQTALPYFVAAQVSIAEHDLRFYEVYCDEFSNVLVNVDAARNEGRAHIVPMEGN